MLKKHSKVSHRAIIAMPLKNHGEEKSLVPFLMKHMYVQFDHLETRLEK